ncbi:unnamed protein product [Peniophora sp. CBMAI 1063]|nr:unnamed protein product [Peniophora sp. CBMAI 1063]
MSDWWLNGFLFPEPVIPSDFSPSFWTLYALTTMTPQRFERLLRACEVDEQARVSLLAYLTHNNLAFQPWVEDRLEAILSPITRLPPEILIEIFRLVAELDPPWCFFPLGDEDEDEDDDEDEFHSMGWLSLSQVNRRWRYLCLSTPDLWASHITLHPNVTELFLERAGHRAPLTIHIEPDNPLAVDADFALLVATKLIGRLRKLVWCTPDAPILRTLLDSLQGGSDLSSLDRLLVEKRGDREADLFRQNYGVGPIDLPNATSVGFQDCFIPFSAPRLVYLNLSLVAISCAHLFDTLKRSPGLKSLELEGCIFSEDVTGCAVVSLPKLRSFIFTGYGDEETPIFVYSAIIAHLLLPASATLLIDLNDQPGHPEEFDPFVPTVLSLWREDPPSGLRVISLNLKHCNHQSAQIEFFSGISHDHAKPHYEHWAEDFWQAKRRAEFRIKSAPNDLVRAIHTRLPIRAELATIVYLSADVDQFDLEGWIRIFQALPNLRTLQLIRRADDESDEGGSEGEAMGAARPAESVGAFTALASPLAIAVPSAPGTSNTSSPAPAALPLPYLNTLWLTRYGEEHGIHDQFILKHLAAAVKKRAELRAPALTSLRLDIVDEPKEEEGEQGGWGDKCVLSGLVESVRWRGC